MPYLRNTFDKFVKVRPTSGESIHQRTLPVTANTAINPGDFVSLSSGALVQAMGANATANGANAAYANGAILGVAMDGCTTAEANAGTSLAVAILDENLEVGLRTWNSTAGDSEPQDMVIGNSYALARWTSSPNTITWYMNHTSGTNGCLVLVEKSIDSAAGDDYGINYFKLAAGYRQG